MEHPMTLPPMTTACAWVFTAISFVLFYRSDLFESESPIA